MARLRCGTHELAIETGRWTPNVPDARKCFRCHEIDEDEKHVVCDCPVYAELRVAAHEQLRNTCRLAPTASLSFYHLVAPQIVMDKELAKLARPIGLQFVRAVLARRAALLKESSG